MGLTRAEQETILRWDEEEQIVHIYSASPKTWRKMAKLGIEPHKVTTLKGEPSGKFYRVPLAEFRWRLKGKRSGSTVGLQKARAARLDSVNSSGNAPDPVGHVAHQPPPGHPAKAR